MSCQTNKPLGNPGVKKYDVISKVQDKILPIETYVR